MRDTLVNIDPLLTELVKLVFTFALVLVTGWLKKGQLFSQDRAASESLIRIATEAAHYGTIYCDQKVTTINGIDVGNPQLAATAQYLLNAASDEISHLQLSDAQVLDAARAALAKVRLVAHPIYQPARGAGEVLFETIEHHAASASTTQPETKAS